MAVEGIVAAGEGIAAGSIALIAFGIDSAIEGLASIVIVWRFTGSRALSKAAKRRAQKLAAVQFFILAPTLPSRPGGPSSPAARDPRRAIALAAALRKE